MALLYFFESNWPDKFDFEFSLFPSVLELFKSSVVFPEIMLVQSSNLF